MSNATTECVVCGKASGNTETEDCQGNSGGRRVWANGLCWDCGEAKDERDMAELARVLEDMPLIQRLRLIEKKLYQAQDARQILKDWRKGVVMEAREKPELPQAIRRAFEHVRQLHPEVEQVFFGMDGRWLYFEKEIDDTVEFGDSIDVSILEAAQAAAEEIGVPCAFAYDGNSTE